IINKQLKNLNEQLSELETKELTIGNKKISIYINEKPIDETYIDPLLDIKRDYLNELIKGYNNIASSNQLDQIDEFVIDEKKIDPHSLHVTIPRIDANNPCRWPTLLHEFAHHILRDSKLEKNIRNEFDENLTEEQLEIFSHLEEELIIDINRWLKECWCDLLATLIIGPSLWFSQYSAFLNKGDIRDCPIEEEYPPKYFRLKLIERIISHRLTDSGFESCMQRIRDCNEVIDYLDGGNPNGLFNSQNSEIRLLFLAFEDYFFSHFFQKANISKLKKMFEPLVKYSYSIDSETVKKFVKNLEKGYPIPSRKKDTGSIVEEPSSVQEIFIAAWIYRNGAFKKKILENFRKLSQKDGDDSDTDFKDILEEFDRFDESILKSIQVSEWFDLLDPISNGKENLDDIHRRIKEIENHTNLEEDEEIESNLLVDKEILDLISNEKLSIIPIINLKEQLGSSSFDIRLGTSFQLYYPSQSSLIDFMDQSSLTDANYNSKVVDLDFTHSITIAPKQFMLTHSMEYLRLPKNIAAEIEGRSSLARLGLEIHMTAGFVDPGFVGTLTLEIYNGGANSIRLYPGIRIGQLRFQKVNYPAYGYSDKETAKYKGLLKHHSSLQFEDQEISLIKNELEKQKEELDKKD
ncbi:MAG: dCTP deaminase, partial [Pseudomonadota bacterium]|nr:dCTP deaminase [Pseudomonadota bacterium]